MPSGLNIKTHPAHLVLQVWNFEIHLLGISEEWVSNVKWGEICREMVSKDHLRDQQNMVLIHRWSLHSGLITWKSYWDLWKVVFIYWCYLGQVWLHVITSYAHNYCAAYCSTVEPYYTTTQWKGILKRRFLSRCLWVCIRKISTLYKCILPLSLPLQN